MRTIDKILSKYWISKEFLLSWEKKWICNWCWAKWGFNFSNLLEKLKKLESFKNEKYDKLVEDLKLVCNIHDYQFFNWWCFLDFICYNFQLAINMTRLLHWTWFLRKSIVFVSVFLWTSFFWFKSFNFN